MAESKTRREMMIKLLSKRKYTARALARFFDEDYRIIVDDIFHISKSILPKRRLIREHAVCNKCGFIFKDRTKQSTPSKCPKCRAESITNPTFHIE